MQLEIARNFAEIRNERHQEAVSQLARGIGEQVTQSSAGFSKQSQLGDNATSKDKTSSKQLLLWRASPEIQ